MTRPPLYFIAKTLETLAICLWLGGFAVAGAVVAPLAFRMLERPEAGALMGACFTRLNGIGFACGGILLLALALEGFAAPGAARALRATRTALVVAALGICLYLGLQLFPEMEALRAGAGGAAAPDGGAFDRFHHLSRQLLSLQMLLLVGVLLASAATAARLIWDARAPWSRRPGGVAGRNETPVESLT